MTFTSLVKSSTRAAVVAAVLGVTALSAVPAAQAAPSVSFGFSIGGNHFNQRSCLSDRQVRMLLRDYGYSDIRFTDRRGRIVTVRAERGPRDYRVTVDACRGRIIDQDRIRGRGRY